MKYYSGVAEKKGITKEEMGAVQSIVMAVAAHKVSAQFAEAQNKVIGTDENE
jgi:hypothetical protein